MSDLSLALIGLVGGLITGISPCVLPVLPVIFLSAGAQGARTRRPQPYALTAGTRPEPEPEAKPDHRRPYLVVAGLALSFAVFTLVGTLVLDALPVPQDVIRWTGLVLLVLLGLGMIVPPVERVLEKPFARIPQRTRGTDRGSFVLGLALGAVYVPCAGPVLAAITVAGATGRIGAGTIVLTVAFAVGTALPLLGFALAGRRLAERLTAFRRHQRRIRTLAGVVVIGLAVALTFHVTDAIQRAVPDYTTALDNDLHPGLGPKAGAALAACQQAAESQATPALADCGAAPALAGISGWLNSPALDLAGLTGKVVLVDFWAYSCINCQRAIAHVNAWYQAYQKDGFVVIGVHTPEYAFEHVPANIEAGAKRLGIRYPVAFDNDYKTWDNYANQSWPADYLIDATGRVRFTSAGEGRYAETEQLIRSLLGKADPGRALPAATRVADRTPTTRMSPETYLGGKRAAYYGGTDPLRAGSHTYRYPPDLQPGTFALDGTWDVGDESVTAGASASIGLYFLASDVYLDVSGTGTLTVRVDQRTTTYQVRGAPNIYTLLHRDTPQTGLLQVTLSPGLSAYSFTFG
ncbi:MAG TPA: cytochrome c biogenesis protein DipZ [Mycobacteriales bacterium]|nr:cytochrome c biogenesis protein DipZ [Mycobacteriales bacterium]